MAPGLKLFMTVVLIFQQCQIEGKLLTICLVPDGGTASFAETACQDGGRDVGTPVARHPGVLGWVDGTRLLEFRVEGILVLGVYPELVG
jgi:hypothetical protein